MNDIPKRRFQLTVDLGADTMKGLLKGLQDIAFKIEHEGSRRVASGGCSVGFNFELIESLEITHDSYILALEKYLSKEKETTP